MVSTLLFYSLYKVKHIETIPIDIKVSNVVGINLDDDAMHFGTLLNGGCSSRDVTIKHEYDHPVNVMISIIGDLEGWTSIEKNDFILEEGQEENVEFKICSPIDAIKDKTYTGTARIVLKRV